jgi:dTDP-4-amino-4,6-dideoxygalactose transaminase
MKKFYFGEPDIGKKEIDAVVSVMKSKWIGFGRVSLDFEEKLAKYLGAKYAAVLSSCTAALNLALVLNNVKPGDEIITTPLTFAATANTISNLGAKPVFADIDPLTLNIDESLIEKAVTPKTRGIIVVHFAGLPANLPAIEKIARKHNLFIIEDAAHAIGGALNGKKIGNSQNLVCFSFYGNKNLTAVEGGLLATSKKAFIKRVKVLRLQGLDKDAWKRYRSKSVLSNEVVDLGYKYNITDIQSAIGLVQLEKLERSLAVREKHARLYDKILSGVEGVRFQKKFADKSVRHALHLYLVIIDPKKFSVSRDKIVIALREEGIFAAIHYKPVHLHKFYREKFGYKNGDFPVAEKIGENIFTLPLLPQLKKSEAKHIAEKTKEILQRYKK